MSKQKIALFDIDHTLFDATKYRKRMFDLIEDCIDYGNQEHVRELLEAQYVAHRKKIGYFDAEFMLREVIKELDVEADAVHIFNTIIEDEASYKEALFEETVDVLEELGKQSDIIMGIFSSGRREHQLRKISFFRHLFAEEHIHIRALKEKELPEVLQRYEKKDTQLFLIDDILPLLQTAKQLRNDLTTVWMKRGHYAEQQQKQVAFTPDYSVYNLREVIPILVKN